MREVVKKRLQCRKKIPISRMFRSTKFGGWHVRWPGAERGMPIFIQQDIAKTPILVDDPTFLLQLKLKDGTSSSHASLKLPDLNILDLGFLRYCNLLHKPSRGNCMTCRILSTISFE
jgi:hypothetical protein